MNGSRFIDLTGQTINGIKVLRMADCERGAGKHIKWIYECPQCHKESKIGSNHLISGDISMCKKCSNKMNPPPHAPSDYFVGAKFGCWTIIKETNFKNAWKVRCECGKEFTPDTVQLRHAPETCNCFIKSHGEKAIYEYLKAHNINYSMQHIFEDLPRRMFDFYLPDLKCCIEFDGEQHFKPVEYFGGEDKLLESIARDLSKEDYCERNNIAMIRIAYYENIEQRLNEEIVRLTKNES